MSALAPELVPDAEIEQRATEGLVAYEDYVQAPGIEELGAGRLMIVDRRPVGGRIPWRFVGVVALATVVALFLGVLGAGWLRGATNSLLAVIAVMAAALLMARGARRGDVEVVPLAWVSASAGLLRVREHPEQRELAESRNIYLEEVQEVLYALRMAHVPGMRERTRVEAAAVFVRLHDGAVWPVIPATLEKERAYAVARRLASGLGVGVKQVGRGFVPGGR